MTEHDLSDIAKRHGLELYHSNDNDDCLRSCVVSTTNGNHCICSMITNSKASSMRMENVYFRLGGSLDLDGFYDEVATVIAIKKAHL